VADTIPDGQRTREAGLADGAPQPRRRSRKTLAWTGTVIGAAVTAGVLTAIFTMSGQSPSLTSSPVETPAAPGAPLTDPAGTGVNGVAFSPDGSMLAVGDRNGSAYLWNTVEATPAARPLRHDPKDGEVGSIAVSSADMVAVGTGNSSRTAGDITLWNGRTHGYLMTLSDPGGSGAPRALAFSPDGGYLVAGDGDGAIYLWNVYLNMPPAILHDPGTGEVSDIAFQPGTHTFAVAAGNGSVYLWDATNRARLGAPLQDPDSGGVQGVAFSPDGGLLAAADANGNVYIWTMTTGKLVQTLHDPQGLQVNDVSFSPNGTAVAVADNNPAHTVSAIRVWILATQQVYTFRNPHTAGALHLAFSPDGSLLAVGDGNGNTYLWDALWLNG
jgi:WD40 repeat protein